MKRSFRTKEEFFLLSLFELATAQGDPHTSVSIAKVGAAIGQAERSVRNIVNILAQTNFLKKDEEGEVYLTPHGLKLVEQLQEEGQSK